MCKVFGKIGSQGRIVGVFWFKNILFLAFKGRICMRDHSMSLISPPTITQHASITFQKFGMPWGNDRPTGVDKWVTWVLIYAPQFCNNILQNLQMFFPCTAFILYMYLHFVATLSRYYWPQGQILGVIVLRISLMMRLQDVPSTNIQYSLDMLSLHERPPQSKGTAVSKNSRHMQ